MKKEKHDAESLGQKLRQCVSLTITFALIVTVTVTVTTAACILLRRGINEVKENVNF